MKLRLAGQVLLATALACVHVGVAQAQVASALLNEGEESDPINYPGYLVDEIDGVTINGIGGFAAVIETTDGTNTLFHIWGSVDGVTPPAILRTQTTVSGLVQESFSSRMGLTDSGSIIYEASGTGGPLGDFDAIFIDDTPYIIEGEATPAGPIEGYYWTSAMQAPAISATGRPFFVGGVDDTPGGTSSWYGFFADNPPGPITFTGYSLPGVPAIVDNGSGAYSSRYRVSRDGNESFTRVAMETTDTGIPSSQNECLLMSGVGFYLDGALVQEGTPVPVAIGGIGENWSSFGSTDYGINEMGEYIFGTDTDASSGEDEVVVINGMIAYREGDSVSGGSLTSTIETIDMNENGDWVIAWKRGGTSFEVLLLNGDVVLAYGDEVDRDGDGTPDAGVLFSDLDVVNDAGVQLSERDSDSNVTLYVNLESNDGSGDVEGIYRLVLPMTPGGSGDLQLGVTDMPDPLISLPGDITYKVTVRNNSPAAIDNVAVVSSLDPTLTFNAGASDPIAVHSAGTVTASLGTMAANAVQVYRFVATADTVGTKTTTHSVSGDTTDTVPGNNDVTSVTDAGAACDLQVSITDDPDPVVTPGGTITYTVTAYNAGPSAATGVEATMNLDPTTVFNAGLSDPSVTHVAGVVTIPVGPLGIDESVDTTVVVNVTTQGLISADAEVTGNQPDPYPESNTTTVDTLYQLTTDLLIAILDAPDPVVPAGGPLTYEVTVTNDGPSDATGVVATITLDDDTVFVSSESPGVHDGSPTGGVVTAAIGSLNSTQSFVFDIVVDTTVEGTVSATGEVAGGGNETDPDMVNNTTVSSTMVLNDISGFARGVFSNIGGSSTSEVPGLPGAQFGSGVDRAFRSPDGKLWVLSADTNLGSGEDEVIIVGSLCSATTMAQEGVTTLSLGDALGAIDRGLSINNAGQFVFATNTNASTSEDEVIVRWDGSQFVDVAREGSECAGATAVHGSLVSYGSSIDSPNILETGVAWFNADTDISSSVDQFLLSKNGNLAVAQEGVTIPGNQGGGASDHWDNMDSGDFWTNADGSSYIAQGDLDGSSTSLDDVFVVDGDVVVQEGYVLPGSGFSSVVDSIDSSFTGLMMSNGDWFVRGTNEDGHDWIIKNGTVIVETGTPLFPGAGMDWDDAESSDGFFLFAGNNAGDYIVGGSTDAPDLAADAVLVLNGETIISRENDPIDLDGNGVLDDGVRIRTYGNDDLFLTDDFQAYVTCTLRDINDDGSDVDIGDAFIRINLCGVARPCGDINGDYDVDVDDYLEFAAAFSSTPCDDEYKVCADLDDDGLISFLDYQLWLECYEDFNGFAFRGVGPVDIEPADPVRQDEVNVRPAGPQLR